MGGGRREVYDGPMLFAVSLVAIVQAVGLILMLDAMHKAPLARVDTASGQAGNRH